MHFTSAGDAGAIQSGIAGCSRYVLVTVETADQLVSGHCVDVAGNESAVTSVTVKLDKSAPAAPMAQVSPAPNAAGWNNSDVTVSFTGNGDTGGSEVEFCTPDQHVTADTAGTVVGGSCTDKAGNTGPQAQVKVKVDKTQPQTTITARPANPTTATSATFAFSSNEPESGFQRRLDGGGWTACTSPKNYPGLAKQSHLFEVRRRAALAQSLARTGLCEQKTSPVAGTSPNLHARS